MGFQPNGGDATKIQGFPVSTTDPVTGQTLVFNESSGEYEPNTPAGGGDMLKAENLSGLEDYSEARSNLGLGTAAEEDYEAFATAAQGGKADSAVQPADLGELATVKSKLDATTAPAVTDDSGDGYAVGSTWVDATADKSYVAVDVTLGAAVWKETTGTGGGGASAFTELTDVPASYSGQGGKVVKVKSDASGLEFGSASGTGDVVGPASVTDGNVALFDTATGKLLKDGGTLGSAAFDDTGDFATAAQGALADSALQAADISGMVTETGEQTLTNKRITRRVGSTTSHATPTINTDSVDCYSITALAEAITSMTTNLSGTPTNFQPLIIRIKDNDTARAISWGASFENAGYPLPATTILGKLMTVGLIYNAVTSKWGCVAVANES